MVAILATLLVGLLTAGSAAAAAGPLTGFWSGSAGGTDVSFVVSHVGATTVLSDLMIHCDGAYGVAYDDEEGFLHEAAIDGHGFIDSKAKPFKRDYRALSGTQNPRPKRGVEGRLQRSSGVVSVDSYLALGPEGHPSSTGNYCPGTENLSVQQMPEMHLMQDGTYAINGTGAPATARIYGRGAALEWRGDFSTPIGGVPNPTIPLDCADEPSTTAGMINWEVMFPTASGAFSGSGSQNGGTVSLTGQYLESEKATGTWTATQTIPFTCTGAGAFEMTLAKPAPPLVPMTPVGAAGSHRGKRGNGHDGKPPKRHERTVR